MVKLLLQFLLFTALLTNSVLANNYIAEVVKVRGEASVLERGSKVARKLAAGDKIGRDSSVLTGNKSFLRIIFKDNTVMNLGPRSKATILETRKDGTSFIHLLKGTLRSKVNKNKGSTKHKYYIKTRSAAMAVRGTEFQAVYNPINNVSSLLTYKGEVAMAKVEEDPAAEVKRLKKIRRKQLANQKVVTTASGDIELIETKADFNLEGRMNQALANKEAVVVKQGQYSGTVNAIKRASIPVKISPVQLNALYANNEMHEKIRRSEVKEQSLKPGDKVLALQPAEQVPPPEGLYEPKKRRYAPRSGGILDMTSGLYVAPEKDAVYNGKLKVFVPSDESGKIDSDTGQFVAPRGLKLDAIKGFVTKKTNNPAQQKILLAKADSLNDATKPKLWAGGDPTRIQAPIFKSWSESEKISKDIIEFEFYGYGESFESTNETGGTNRKFESDDAKRMLIRWSHNSESNWQPITTIGFKTTEFSAAKRGAVGQPTRDGVMLGIGVRYNMSPRWSIVNELIMEQELYMTSESSVLFLKRVSVPKLKIGAQGALYQKGKFTLDGHLYLQLALPKESGDHKLDTGLGFGFDLLPRWWINKRWTVYSGFSVENQSQGVSTTGFKADNSHSKAGLKLGFGYLF